MGIAPTYFGQNPSQVLFLEKLLQKNPMITASNINFAKVKCPKKLETCKINKNCKEQGPHSFFQAGPPVPKTAAVSIKESYFFKRPT